MDRASLKAALLFGLICLATGRILSPFHPKENARGLRINEVPARYTAGDNLMQKLRPDDTRRRQNRLSEAEFSTYSLQEPNGPGTYAFGYDNVADPMGNEHFRSEERLQNGTVMGEYGYTDYKNGKLVRVSYIADLKGYRAKTEVLSLDGIY